MITHDEGLRNTPIEKLAADGGHSHTHGAGHEHSHTCGDGHELTHVHSDGTGHAHESGRMNKAKLVSLLGYMSEHNFEHANELRNLIGAASELGDENVADMIEQSANDIENAAQNIAIALKLITEK